MLVNGTRQSELSINNRGLAYGDGLFETILLHHGSPVMLDEHLSRLQSGLEKLGIENCIQELKTDIAALKKELNDFGVMKIIVTRGAGGRGYLSDSKASPDRIITLHPLPDYSQANPDSGIKAKVAAVKLALQPQLAGLKHLNRLEQVLASQELGSDDCFEALMLDLNGRVIEGTRSNIFAVIEGAIVTPVLDQCGVKGVLRELLLAELNVQERELHLQELKAASELFFGNSVGGVWPVLELNNQAEIWQYPIGPFSSQARSVFEQTKAKVQKDAVR